MDNKDQQTPQKKILSVKDLSKYFTKNGKIAKVLDELTFDIYEGDFFGVIGESGSGKSTTGKCVIRLYESNGGIITFLDKIINNKHISKSTRAWLCKNMQMIFQDPMSSLNPRKNVLSLIAEPIKIDGTIKAEAKELIDICNIINRYFGHTFVWQSFLLNREYLLPYFKSVNQLLLETVQTLKAATDNQTTNIVAKVDEMNGILNRLEVGYTTKKIKHQIIDAIKITQKRKYHNAVFEINAYFDKKLSKKQISNVKYISESASERDEKLKQAKEDYKKAISKKAVYEKMYNVLSFIGIKNIERSIEAYPHEFSGGMRQRIVIAMTIVGEPDLIIADEPTTALDVTIQAKVIDLIKKLRDHYKIAIIFISHNISLVANLCDYIYIMYAGKIVEKGTVSDIFIDPKHPYTWALIGSIPDMKSSSELTSIIGTPPNMISPPKGDAFAARNIYARKIDFEKQPPMFQVSPTHYAATWLLHKDAPPFSIPKEIKGKLEIAKRSIAIKNKRGGKHG